MTQTDIKRLYRSRTNRMVAGVSGGLGEFLGLDPTIVRLIFVFSTLLLGGSGLLVYVVMLLVVPEEPLGEGSRQGGTMAAGRQSGSAARVVADDVVDTAAEAPKPKRKAATKK